MADGPAIQASSLRALAAGQNMVKTLAMVARFRERDDLTPIVLMGYYNPIYVYGVERFLKDAKAAGVDGLILVGGDDIDPAAYGQPDLGVNKHVSASADASDLAFATAAFELDLPLFAICRGCQVLNVAMGGTLHQDMTRTGTHHPPISGLSRSGVMTSSTIRVNAGKRLRSVLAISAAPAAGRAGRGRTSAARRGDVCPCRPGDDGARRPSRPARSASPPGRTPVRCRGSPRAP